LTFGRVREITSSYGLRRRTNAHGEIGQGIEMEELWNLPHHRMRAILRLQGGASMGGGACNVWEGHQLSRTVPKPRKRKSFPTREREQQGDNPCRLDSYRVEYAIDGWLVILPR